MRIAGKDRWESCFAEESEHCFCEQQWLIDDAWTKSDKIIASI